MGNLVVSSTKPNVSLPDIFRRPLNHQKKGRLKIDNRPAVFLILLLPPTVIPAQAGIHL
ncbi:hypothetical protein HMPREF3156_00876 [Neisseria sp. HMSC06F02]|nr:hypothetical protein HMPREF3156_00876 [Neisseria sp. HMSC06F02]